jgi:hypothetical protein
MDTNKSCRNASNALWSPIKYNLPPQHPVTVTLPASELIRIANAALGTWAGHQRLANRAAASGRYRQSEVAMMRATANQIGEAVDTLIDAVREAEKSPANPYHALGSLKGEP